MNHVYLSRCVATSLLVGLMTASAPAAVLITTADGNGADTGISNDPNQSATSTHGGEASAAVRHFDGTRAKLALFRFDLTGIPTTDRVGAVMALTLNSTANRDRTFNIYGLTDQTLDNWDEATTSYSNAPAILTPDQGANSGYYKLDDAKWSLLGTIGMNGSAAQAISSDNGLTDTSLDLDSFLASDTNDLVNFLVVNSNSDSTASYFIATKENTTGTALPTLTLPNATPVPEPASLSLLALAALPLARRRRPKP